MCEMYSIRPRFLPANRTVSHGSAQEPRDVPWLALRFDLVPARQIQLFLARRPVHAPAEHFLDPSKIVGLQKTVKIVALPACFGRGRRILPAQKCCKMQVHSNQTGTHLQQGKDDRRVREELGSIGIYRISSALVPSPASCRKRISRSCSRSVSCVRLGRRPRTRRTSTYISCLRAAIFQTCPSAQFISFHSFLGTRHKISHKPYRQNVLPPNEKGGPGRIAAAPFGPGRHLQQTGRVRGGRRGRRVRRGRRGRVRGIGGEAEAEGGLCGG